MCGIVGIYNYNKNERVKPGVIKAMAKALAHRGPDGEGFYFGENIALGHTRLSIIDLSGAGIQPIYNENRDIAVVCNGEIYNARELRINLTKKGHKFLSESDNEVIPHLYEEYGIKFVSMLTGMFAFALWDSKEEQLFLVRDRLGIKPLFYDLSGKRIAFASEIKSLLVLSDVKKEINFESLHHYFFSNQIPGPLTIFEGIKSIAPAEIVIISKNKQEIKKDKYWEANFKENYIGSDKETTDQFIKILEKAVKRHSLSDAPVGLALSGGLDSSLLLAILSKFNKSSVESFTFEFSDDVEVKRHDFLSSQKISRYFKSNHHTFLLKPKNLVDEIENIVFSLDEPVNTFAADYYLAKAASKKVKVLFTGDGTEELFGKYWNHRLAQSMTHVLDYCAGDYYKKLYKMFILEYSRVIPERSWHYSDLLSFGRFDEGKLYSLQTIRQISDKNIEKYWLSCFSETKASNFYNKVLEIDTNNFLPNHTLKIIDRVSMANSVEIRPPYLDHELVEFVAALPARMKSRQGVTKYLLKEVAKRYLPQEMVKNFRSGITGPPINEWMVKHLKKMILDVLSKKRILKHGILNAQYVNKLLEEHYAHFKDNKSSDNYYFQNTRYNHTTKIWKLLIFQLWWEKVFNKE